MPKIELKPKSPEYQDEKPPEAEKTCDHMSCSAAGEFRAPKGRDCKEYFHFCLDHVKEYNSSWNFFDGMSAAQVQEHLLRSLYGDRPTWKSADGRSAEETLKQKIWQNYHGHDDDSSEQDKEKRRRTGFFAYHHDTPEYKAIALLNLEPPLNLDKIKKRYKALAKKHHPDVNEDKEKAQELLKEINIAYTTLKDAFEKYEKIIDDYE